MLYDERSVGEPFFEGAVGDDYYAFQRGEHVLVMVTDDANHQRYEDVSRGACAFGLIVDQPVIWFCWTHRPCTHWSDLPFSWHLMPERDQELPPLANLPPRAAIQQFLVDQRTGLLLAKRRVLVSERFSRRLHEAIADQAAREFDELAYGRKVALMDEFAVSTDERLPFLECASLGEGARGERALSAEPTQSVQ